MMVDGSRGDAARHDVQADGAAAATEESAAMPAPVPSDELAHPASSSLGTGAGMAADSSVAAAAPSACTSWRAASPLLPSTIIGLAPAPLRSRCRRHRHNLPVVHRP